MFIYLAIGEYKIVFFNLVILYGSNALSKIGKKKKINEENYELGYVQYAIYCLNFSK